MSDDDPQVYVEDAAIQSCYEGLRLELQKHPTIPVAFLIAVFGKICGHYIAAVPEECRDQLCEIWQNNAQLIVDEAERAAAGRPPTSGSMN